MPDPGDHDARQRALLRALERLRSEIAERGTSELSPARQLALAFVERIVTGEAATMGRSGRTEARSLLTRGK